MTDEKLEKHTREVMGQITMLSTLAKMREAGKQTKLSNDLYYAANRAWRELDAIVNRRPTDG